MHAKEREEGGKEARRKRERAMTRDRTSFQVLDLILLVLSVFRCSI